MVLLELFNSEYESCTSPLIDPQVSYSVYNKYVCVSGPWDKCEDWTEKFRRVISERLGMATGGWVTVSGVPCMWALVSSYDGTYHWVSEGRLHCHCYRFSVIKWIIIKFYFSTWNIMTYDNNYFQNLYFWRENKSYISINPIFTNVYSVSMCSWCSYFKSVINLRSYPSNHSMHLCSCSP